MGLVFTVTLYSAFPLYPLSTANSISTTGNLQRRLASEGGGNSVAKSLDTRVGLQIIWKSRQWDFLCLCCVWAKPTKRLFLSDRWERRNKMFQVVCFCMNFSLTLVTLSSFSLFNCTGLQLHSAGENVLCLCCSEITIVISTLQGYLENPFFLAFHLHRLLSQELLMQWWFPAECQNFKQGLLRVVSFLL